MATIEHLIGLVRAQKAAGFFSFLQLQEHIDAASAQLTGVPPIERSVGEWAWLVFEAVPLLWWQLLFLGLWGILLVRAAAWWQKKRFLPLFSLLFCMALVAPGVWLRYRLSSTVDAVIKTEAVMHSGPSQSFVQMGTLPIGERVRVEAEYSPRPEVVFAKVVTHKKRAWVEKSALGIA